MKLVITPHRPVRRVLNVVGIFLVALIVVAVAFDYGHWRSIAGAMVTSGEHGSMLDELVALKRENDALSYDLKRARRAEEINRAALAENRQLMVELTAELAESEKDVKFFRDAVGSAKVGSGPRVGGIQVKNLGGDGRYGYVLVMTHITKDDKVAEGVLQVRLKGEQNGEAKRLAFADIVESGPETLAFKFKHFYLFEGTLKIPNEFVPRQFEVAVRGRGLEASAATFDWTATLN